jgi:hypothetical protein
MKGILLALLLLALPASAARADCAEDEDCPTGFRCVGCACRDTSTCGCLADADCGQGEWCDRATCACVTTEPEPFDACHEMNDAESCAQSGQGSGVLLGVLIGSRWVIRRLQAARSCVTRRIR